jgi:serpin B
LGASRAFTPAANFSGISDKNLFVSNVIQKTFIDVNEDGVEAAASTFGGGQKCFSFVLFLLKFVFQRLLSSAVTIIPPEVIQFHADHPFIFYIKVKDLIIFAGRVKQPSYN